MHRRITAIADLVPPSECAADVGCDHGKLGALLLESGRVSRLIATDISEPSLAKARQELKKYPDAQFRCGDGLSVLRPGEADIICIAGMGGLQMTRMLKERPDIARRAQALILSPHRNDAELRRYLRRSDYQISKETVVVDRGHFYLAMRVVPGNDPEEDPLWEILPKGDPCDALFRSYAEHLVQKMQKRIQILAQAAPNDADLPALQFYTARIMGFLDEHKPAGEHH